MACTSGGIQVQPLCSPCTGTRTDPCYSGFTVDSCNVGTVPNTLLLSVPAEAFRTIPSEEGGLSGCTRCAANFAGDYVLVFDPQLSFYAATPSDPNACAWGYRRTEFSTRCGFNANPSTPTTLINFDYVFWFSGDGVGHVALFTFSGDQPAWKIHWQGTVTAGPGDCLAIDADLAWDRDEPYPFLIPFVYNNNCYGVPGTSVHVQSIN